MGPDLEREPTEGPSIPPSQISDRAAFLALLFVLVAFTGLAVGSMALVDQTVDEPKFVDGGRYILRAGWDHPLARLHGPLPYYATQIAVGEFPPGGYRALEDPRPLLFRGRLGFLPFGWLGIAVVFLWGRRLYGNVGALLAVGLYGLHPLILGYGALMSVDMAQASCVLLCLYLLWRHLQRPTFLRALGVGLGLGVALATKYLALLVAPVIVFLAVFGAWRRWPDEGPGRIPTPLAVLGILGGTALATLVTLHAAYLFGSGLAPRDPSAYASDFFATCMGWPGIRELLALFPADYLLGLDYQVSVGEGDRRPYLLGRFAPGHGSYYLWSFLLKTPEWSLLLCAWALLWRVPKWLLARTPFALRSAAWVLVFPAAVPWIYLSYFTDLQIGVRYVLAVFPMVLLLAAGVCTEPWVRRSSARGVWISLTSLLLLQAADVARYWPNTISYYNLSSRGSVRSYKYFRDSNTDWGQMQNVGLDRLRSAGERDFGVVTEFDGPRFGRWAIHLRHLTRRDSRDTTRSYHWLQDFEPVRNVDGAWWLYDITPELWRQRLTDEPDGRLRAGLALAYLGEGEREEAMRTMEGLDDELRAPLETLLVLLESAEGPETPLPTLLATVQAWTAVGRHDKVEALLRDPPQVRLRDHPHRPLLLAAAVAKQGRVDEGIRILEESNLEAYPRSALMLSRYYYNQVRYGDSVAVLERTLPFMDEGLAEEARTFLAKAREKHELYLAFQDRL